MPDPRTAEERLREALGAVFDRWAGGDLPNENLRDAVISAALAAGPVPVPLDVNPWTRLHDHGFSWDDVNALAAILDAEPDLARALATPPEPKP